MIRLTTLVILSLFLFSGCSEPEESEQTVIKQEKEVQHEDSSESISAPKLATVDTNSTVLELDSTTSDTELIEDTCTKESSEVDMSTLTYKPIIYIYPTSTCLVNIKLNYDGFLTHTYPRYKGGWSVTASPDGTLLDAKMKEYYALYWEGKPNKQFTIDEGTVVKGEETIPFLEKTLATLGLNRKEANEFIIYWLPKLEKNRYNLFHFSTTQYEEMAQMKITPTPESLIRVMMVYQPLDEKVEIKPQDLDALSKSRKGFTVVEWGGHPLPKDAKQLL